MKETKTMKNKVLPFLLLCCSVTTLGGCSKKHDPIEITMYLWDKNMTKTLTPWLEEQFPEYKMTFIVGYNSMDFYTDLTNRGEPMPDIITCRRFSINDATHLSNQLMDLSDTDVAGSFYDAYIENNRETDSGIRWLPSCAEVDGYIANLDLFEKYNVKVPTNYEEFKTALATFEENGVRGFANDWGNDYACLEVLQGHSIPLLMSREGRNWRMKYESETDENPVGLDDVVWPKVFERFETYLNDIHYVKEDYKNSSQSYAFTSGKLAIMRGTANDCNICNNNGMNTVMLPFFGESERDNWVLTYPMYQLAVAKSVEEDSTKKEAVLKVIEKMFSEEGQKTLASSTAVLSYNKDTNLELGKPFSRITDCIEGNRLYMRLASTEFFPISQSVVRKMLNGKVGYNGSTYNAKDAYPDFNDQLLLSTHGNEAEPVIVQETAYSSKFGEHGIPAASSLMNTLRQGSEVDVSIGYSPLISAPIFEGNYSLQQLTWFLTTKTGGYSMEFSGAEIVKMMEWLINIKEDESNPIRNYYYLPVTSGIEYTVKELSRGKYSLSDVTVAGEPIDLEKVYKVMTLSDDTFLEDPAYCNCPMPTELKEKREMISGKNVNILTNSFAKINELQEIKQFLAAEDYITITK